MVQKFSAFITGNSDDEIRDTILSKAKTAFGSDCVFVIVEGYDVWENCIFNIYDDEKQFCANMNVTVHKWR